MRASEVLAEGEWWMPDDPANRGPGTLTSKPGARPELLVAGTLGRAWDDLAESDPVILGRSKGGEEFTLEGCTATLSFSVGTRGQGECFHARPLRVYRGLAHERIHETPVKAVAFELDFFLDWLRAPPVNHPTETPKLPTDIQAKPSDGTTVSITFRAGEAMEDMPGYSKTCAIARIEWPTPRGLREADLAAHRLGFFFALGMARAPKLRNVTFVTPTGGSIDDVLTEGDLVGDEWLRLQPGGGFEFAEVKGTLSRSIEAWEKFAEEARPIMEILVGDLYNSSRRMPAPFLALATALEGYHRLQMEKTPRDGPQAAKDPAMRAKQHLDATWQLADRFADLYDQVHADIGPEVQDGRDKARRIAQVRNYYSHYMRDAKGADYRPKSHGELQDLARLARVLLVAHVLRDIGLPSTRLQALAKHWMSFRTYTLPGYEP